jgi:hypothetical protein
MGGPGGGPEPNQPLYVCRANVQGSTIPGKWLKGNCNVASGGHEVIVHEYQVAYGNASWQPYVGNTNGLVQAGTDAGGAPLFSCRANGDQGYQPGKMLNGMCRIPLGGNEVVVKPPFDALYVGGRTYPISSPSAYSPAYPQRRYARYAPPSYPPPGYAPSSYPTPNPSTVTWRPAKAPAVPGSGAIQGGPGNGPNPGSPLYICRAQGYNGGMLPGKWIEGKCSFATGWEERKNKNYEVAYGAAVWGPYFGIKPEMIQGGTDVDGTPLYVCRVRFVSGYGDKGFQPGYLRNSLCMVPYTQATSNPPPFQVLYNAGTNIAALRPPPPARNPNWRNSGSVGPPEDGGNSPDAYPGDGNEPGNEADSGPENGADNSADNDAGNGPQLNAPSDADALNGTAPQGPQGMRVVFDSGTGATAGGLIIKNAATGTSITRQLAPNMAPGACLKTLQQAALDAGLEIQMDGDGVKIAGPDNTLSVNGADVTVTAY